MINDKQTNNNIKLKKFMEISVCDRSFYFPLKDVKEVVPRFEISSVPLTPQYLKGLINLRGKIISVIDLGKRINNKSIEIVPKKSCIVILSLDDIEVGVLVDEVIAVRSIDEKMIESNTSAKNKRNEFITAVVRGEENEKIKFLLNLSKALEIDEIKKMLEKDAAGI